MSSTTVQVGPNTLDFEAALCELTTLGFVAFSVQDVSDALPDHLIPWLVGSVQRPLCDGETVADAEPALWHRIHSGQGSVSLDVRADTYTEVLSGLLALARSVPSPASSEGVEP